MTQARKVELAEVRVVEGRWGHLCPKTETKLMVLEKEAQISNRPLGAYHD